MDVERLRRDFPLLREIIYLDSASTSLTPEPVLQAVLDYYRGYKANVGRGVYRTAQIADQRYRDAHRKAADFIGGRDKGLTVFTRNATESINIVSRGLRWKKGDRIVTTLLEHHSNLLPWIRQKQLGADLEIMKPDREGMLDISELDSAITEHTRLVAISQVSNSLGTILPVKEIGEICQDRGAALLVDGAQSVPHMPLRLDDLHCDFLCFSGHKMLSPMGAGVLWMRKEDEIEPLLAGGGMVEDADPDGYVAKRGYEGYEAGTPDIPAAIGLGRALDYLKEVGMEEVHSHEQKLALRLKEGLQGIKGVVVYGPAPGRGRQSGVVSFSVEGLLPHEVAMMLDQAAGICVRSGHHCCIPLMKHLGLKYGTVRASVYLYNTEAEIERLLATVEEIARMA